MSQPNDARGYIRLHRKMLENPLFTGKPAEWFKLWVLILLRVNWRPSAFRPHAGSPVEIPAGSMVTSLEKLAHAGDTTREQARKCLAYLERTGAITLQRTHHWTKINVLNWATYQQVDNAPEHTEAHAQEHTDFKNESVAGPYARTRRRTPSKEEKNNSTTLSNSNELDAVHRSAPKRQPEIDPDVRKWFDEQFWPLYPRHEGKHPALASARRKGTTPEKRRYYMERLNAQLPEYLRRKAESGQNVIPLAATWFNQERADDEFDPLPEKSRTNHSDDWPEYVSLRA